MYRYHRLEFNRHIKNILVLFICSEITILCFFIATLDGFYSGLCLSDELDPDSDHALVDINAD